MKQCLQCGKDITDRPTQTKFCSHECVIRNRTGFGMPNIEATAEEVRKFFGLSPFAPLRSNRMPCYTDRNGMVRYPLAEMPEGDIIKP